MQFQFTFIVLGTALFVASYGNTNTIFCHMSQFQSMLPKELPIQFCVKIGFYSVNCNVYIFIQSYVDILYVYLIYVSLEWAVNKTNLIETDDGKDFEK